MGDALSIAPVPTLARHSGHRHPLLRDLPFAWGSVGAAGCIAVEALGPSDSRPLMIFAYLCSIGFLVCAVGYARRVAAGLVGHPGHRFWRAGVGVVGLLAASTGTQLWNAVGTAQTRHMIEQGSVSVACTAAAMLLAIVVILTYPVALDARYTRHRFWLDMAIVMAATVTVGAYFGLGTIAQTSAGLAQWAAELAGGPVVMLIVAFGLARLLLSGQAPFTRAAGLLQAAAGGVSGLSTTLVPLLVQLDRPNWFLAMDMTANAGVMLAFRAQQVGVEIGVLGASRRRTFSALPYVAVLAVYGLLIAVLAIERVSVGGWIVAVGATLCTGSVMVRQLSSLTDNERLLQERESLLETMHHQAFHDGLTGLANRTLFFERLEHGLAAARRALADVAVLLVDLDDFKQVNDRYGHGAGDAVLVAVAERMRATLRESDTVARLGGDEFAVVITVAAPDQVELLVQRMIAAVCEPVAVDGGVVEVGCSVGVAMSRAGVGSGADLLKAADEAMYSVKGAGKGGHALVG